MTVIVRKDDMVIIDRFIIGGGIKDIRKYEFGTKEIVDTGLGFFYTSIADNRVIPTEEDLESIKIMDESGKFDSTSTFCTVQTPVPKAIVGNLFFFKGKSVKFMKNGAVIIHSIDKIFLYGCGDYVEKYLFDISTTRRTPLELHTKATELTKYANNGDSDHGEVTVLNFEIKPEGEE